MRKGETIKCIDCRYFVPNGETEGYCSEFVYPVNTSCYCNIDPASAAKEQGDLVEVVRCKDCVLRYNACPMAFLSPGENNNTWRVSFFTEDDDFCSRGKR